MDKNYKTITKATLLGILLFVIGIIHIYIAIDNAIAFRHSKALSSLSITTLKEELYIEDTITKTFGSYGTFLGINSIEFYVIPIGDGKEYITIFVTKAYADLFSGLTANDNNASPIDIHGIIKKLPPNILNYPFLKNLFNLSDNSDIDKIVSSKYCIEIIDLQKSSKFYKSGFSLLISGIILSLSFFRKSKI